MKEKYCTNQKIISDSLYLATSHPIQCTIAQISIDQTLLQPGLSVPKPIAENLTTKRSTMQVFGRVFLILRIKLRLNKGQGKHRLVATLEKLYNSEFHCNSLLKNSTNERHLTDTA